MELHDIREVCYGTSVLALHCYSGDKKQNTGFFQMTCFKECKNMAAEIKLRANDRPFIINNVLQLSHGIKNIYRRNCTNTYTLEKMFFEVASFEGLQIVSFQTELKTCSALWSV